MPPGQTSLQADHDNGRSTQHENIDLITVS
jgi:hypothetical protein